MSVQSTNKCSELPTFFRALVHEAKTSRYGYAVPGYHIGIHLIDLVNGWVNDEAGSELATAIHGGKPVDEIWKWLRRYLPRCMAIVPMRRKGTFMEGIMGSVEEGKLYLTRR